MIMWTLFHRPLDSDVVRSHSLSSDTQVSLLILRVGFDRLRLCGLDTQLLNDFARYALYRGRRNE